MTRLDYQDDGTYTKTINAGDARTALTDAIADLMHVLAHEGADDRDLLHMELGVAFTNALTSAEIHYDAERAGEDGIKIEIEEEEA